MTIWNRCSDCSSSSCPPQRNQTALQTSNGWRTLTSQGRCQPISRWTWMLSCPKGKALNSILKVEETLRHYLSPFLKTLPRSFTHSLSFICNSSFANSRAILQSLVRSSDKNSDGAMDFEELTTFGDFNLVYNIWPQHLQMAINARWGMKKWVIFFILTSLLDQPHK